jgi:putative colanic acid biosynthesis acetyltransferase WcaF
LNFKKMVHNISLDIITNRRTSKYSRRILAARVAWRLFYPLFRLSPRPFWGWRRLLLRSFGARIGPGAHIYPTVQITMPWNIVVGEYAAVGDRAILYALGPIVLGARVTISQRAHLCAGTHDITDPARPLLTPPIYIESDVWICADAFVGPGVTVGSGAVVGARSVVTKNIEKLIVVAGNPAKKIKDL